MNQFHRDRLSSVLALSTDGGGKDAWYRYDPYGQPRAYNRNSNQAAANNLMYVGLYRDASTGLVRMGARWYDPTIGRFTQADPSGQEVNPYLYAAGNPINNVDPNGLMSGEDFTVAAGSTLLGIGVGAACTLAGAGIGCGLALGAVGGGLWGGASAAIYDHEGMDAVTDVAGGAFFGGLDGAGGMWAGALKPW